MTNEQKTVILSEAKDLNFRVTGQWIALERLEDKELD